MPAFPVAVQVPYRVVPRSIPRTLRKKMGGKALRRPPCHRGSLSLEANGPQTRFVSADLTSDVLAGAATADVCGKHGISSATFYKWKAKYGGLEVSDAKRLKALEDENRRLKRLLADSLLDNAALKDLLGKNV